MDITISLLLLGAGIIGGAVSAVAGGSSFFTFPALLYAGLPPLQANTTNFVALTPGNMTALIASRRYMREMLPALVLPLIVSCIGAGCGSLLLLWAGNNAFARLVPWLMAAAVMLFALGPALRKWLMKSHDVNLEPRSPAALFVLFLISGYGGYFGAGLGVIILSGLAIIGYDDVREANAVKNLLISCFSVVTVAIFIASGTVHWPYAITMMAGTAFGGYLGGHLTWKLPKDKLRSGIIYYGVLLSIYYFWKY